jgi:hypothetical protein
MRFNTSGRVTRVLYIYIYIYLLYTSRESGKDIYIYVYTRACVRVLRDKLNEEKLRASFGACGAFVENYY